MKKQLLIIGAGPAGLTAAIYACRYGLLVTVFEAFSAGGQVMTTPEIENYPGFLQTDGFTLSNAMREQAVALGAVIKNEEVTGVSLTDKKVTTSQAEYNGDFIILALGAKRRKLGCIGEEEFMGKGVSYCATCDGAFFRGKTVAIVGGGNTALEDALFLSKNCEKVYLIHRRKEFRGMRELIDRVSETENITLYLDCEVKEITGEKRVSSIILSKSDAPDSSLSVSGIFIAVGTEPNTAMLEESGEIKLDKSGYIVSGEDCKTAIKGVYAAGDCRQKPLRQIVTATADGAVAAFFAASEI